MIIKYISLGASAILFLLLAGRSVMLRKRGIKAFVFAKTDKSDFFLVILVLFVVYSLIASTFDLPFPVFLKRPFYGDDTGLKAAAGLLLCAASVVWIAVTLVSFGKSFRVGIDRDAPDKLITTGVFAYSRNPVYLGMALFFSGLLLVFFNLSVLIFLVLFCAAIHMQVLREEKFLRMHYGDEYKEYCSNVKRYF